jgi:hypothetical protein
MILDRSQDPQKQCLARCRKQIDAIKIDKPCEGVRVNLVQQPFPGIAMLQVFVGMNRSTVEQPCKRFFPNSRFSLNGRYLEAGSHNVDLTDKTACGFADGDKRLPHIAAGAIEHTRPSWLRLQKVLSRHPHASPVLPLCQRLAVSLSAKINRT